MQDKYDNECDTSDTSNVRWRCKKGFTKTETERKGREAGDKNS